MNELQCKNLDCLAVQDEMEGVELKMEKLCTVIEKYKSILEFEAIYEDILGMERIKKFFHDEVGNTLNGLLVFEYTPFYNEKANGGSESLSLEVFLLENGSFAVYENHEDYFYSEDLDQFDYLSERYIVGGEKGCDFLFHNLNRIVNNLVDIVKSKISQNQ